MHRRTLLSSATAAVASLGAGCLGDGDGGPAGSDDGNADSDGDAPAAGDDASDAENGGTNADGGAAASGTWPLTGYDGGTTRATDASGPRDAALAWSLEAGHDEAGPIVGDGTVFTTGGGVAAVDAATGERRSGHPLDGVAGKPLGLAGDVLVALESYTTLHGYERSSGDRLWTFEPEAYPNYTVGPDAVYGRVITDPAVFAVDAATGERTWSVDAEDANGPIAPTGDLTYVEDGGVRVLADGTERGAWASDWRINTLVADAAAAFVATDESRVVKVEPDGAEAWSIAPFSFGNVLALTDDELYVTDGSVVEVVDRDTGDVRSIGESVGPAKYLTVGSETLYGVGDGRVAAWDRADGDLLWEHQYEGEAAFGPVVLEDLVLVHWTAGSLSKLQAFEAV